MARKIIDLSIDLYDGFGYPAPYPFDIYPNSPKLKTMTVVSHRFTEGRFRPPCKGLMERVMLMAEHCGTHIDAPLHFFEGGKSIIDYPVENFVGEAVLIDVSQLKDPTIPISAEHLERAVKEQQVDVKKGDIIVVRTWPGKWGEEGYWTCRGFSKDGADWVVGKGAKAIGMNCPMSDDIMDLTRPAHIAFFSNGIPPIEHLCNVEKITAKRFQFVALPLKIRDATGSPTRAIAIIDE
jgi:kynurenine formamidase